MQILTMYLRLQDPDYPARELLFHSPQTRGWQSPRYRSELAYIWITTLRSVSCGAYCDPCPLQVLQLPTRSGLAA